MLIITTKSGTEIRLPVADIAEVREVEPGSGAERPVAAHPYLHREGVQRCAACWRPPTDAAHAGQGR